MTWLDRVLRRGNRHAELDEEIRTHIAMDVRSRVARGEPPDEAERAARREFGNAVSVAEVTREIWGGAPLERFVQDVRYGFRSLRRTPGFVVVALLSLALGIGANTAAFSLADAALFRPLAVRDSSSLVAVGARTPRTALGNLSFPEIEDLRRATRSFSGLVGSRTVRVAVARPTDPVPQMRFALAVTDRFFDVLGVEAALGRGFLPQEASTRGREPVAMLSREYWQTHFGADPAIVGSTVRINDQPFTVVGVLPASFTGLSQFLRPSLFLPLTVMDRPGEPSPLDHRDQALLIVRGRLAPGVSLAEAQAELEVVTRALAAEHPSAYRERGMVAMTEFRGRLAETPPLLPLMGLLMLLAALVLVIACANVAVLQLARARARSREMAVRLAIGAGRMRLTRQLLTESLLMAVAGGAAGVAGAFAAIRLLASLQLPTDTPLGLAVQLDARVLVAATVAAAVATCVFGLAPAWRTAAVAPTMALRSDDLSAGRGRLWGRHALVGGQIALCTVLLVVSGALLDAFRRMSAVDPGIRAAQVMMFEFDPALVGRTPEDAATFFRLLVDHVRQTPGVASAALASAIPFRPNFSVAWIVPEGYVFRGTEDRVQVPVNVVSEGYFDTMGAELVRGRAFAATDGDAAPAVAIVNEELAARYWNGDALGKRLFLLPGREPVEIVGVAATAKYTSLMETPQPQLLLPHGQRLRSRMVLLAEAEGHPPALTAPILEVVRSIDPAQPVFNVRDFRTYYGQGALAMPRVLTQMAGAAGLVGLGLALIGVYGLVSYTVARRTREFGIRMAIGAGRGDVRRLVLTQGLWLGLTGGAAGTLLGAPVFLALSGAMAGLGPLTPWTLLAVPVGLVLVALAACWVPSRRATGIDPTIALRTE